MIHQRGLPAGERRLVGLQTHNQHDLEKKEEEKVGEKEKKCFKFSVNNFFFFFTCPYKRGRRI
jgi:hypothetical protein